MTAEEPLDATEEQWAWAHASEESDHEPIPSAQTVTAVMVVHNASEWLADQLESLAVLEPRPGEIRVIDVASSDDGAELLAKASQDGTIDELLEGEAGLGFGEAVAQALGETEPEWIWLLHDDSAPRPNALEELLRGASATGAAVVVPKLLEPARRNYPDTLSEIGQSITRRGIRVLTVEEGDIDQRQHTAAAVLGGSTAGMLIRGDVWRELGGLAVEIPFHREGVEFGWRAYDAGYSVSTWPEASLHHRRAGRTGQRDPDLAAGAHEVDRLGALRIAAARGTKPTGRWRLTFACLLRALGFLLAKSPSHAAAELRALRRFHRTRETTAELAGRSQPAHSQELAEVLPPRFWTLRHVLDRGGSALAERYRHIAFLDAGTDLDELTGDDFAGGRTRERRISLAAVVLTVLLMAGVVAGRTLLSSGLPAGGGILPAPSGLQAAWTTYLQGGTGTGSTGAPWLGIAALGSTLLLGSPAALVVASLLLTPLLAAGSAGLLLREFSASRTQAALGGSLWAAAVLLLGIVTAGDTSGMVLSVAGPLLARSVYRAATSTATGAERLRAPASLGLWTILVASFWPPVLLIVTALGLIWLAKDRSYWVELLISVAVPWLFFVPWLPTLARWWGRILTGADPLAWPSWPQASSALLVGRILPSGLPLWVNVVFFAALGLATLFSMVSLSETKHRMLAALGIGAPLLLGVLVSRFTFAVNGGQTRALLSGWALLVVAAMLATIFLPYVCGDVEPGRIAKAGSRGLLLVALLAVAAWAVIGFRGLVGPSPQQLPGYVHDVTESSRQTRVLMIELVGNEELSWNVADATQPTWGTGERNPAGAFAVEFAGLVQSFSGGNPPSDVAERLSSLGVSHVWMKGFEPDIVAETGNAVGLSSAAAGEDTVILTVQGVVSRAQIIGMDETVPVVDGRIPAGDDTRWLVLAEAADSNWYAKVASRALEQDVQRPPVTFELPADVEGQLTYGMRSDWAMLIWQAVLVALLYALFAPTISGTTTARRAVE